MEDAGATVKVEDVGLASISLSSRVPDFWTDQPRVWFIQLESIIAPQKLGDYVKFNLVVSKLGKEVILQVTDILIAPPEEKKYETLKKRLLTIYEESECRQLQKLIGEMELGDQKPTQLLRKMQDLARGKIGDDTLSVLWQNHLPANVRAVLASIDATSPKKLAVVADKILESSRNVQVAEVSSAGNGSTEIILAEIAKLNLRLTDMERGCCRDTV